MTKAIMDNCGNSFQKHQQKVGRTKTIILLSYDDNRERLPIILKDIPFKSLGPASHIRHSE